jgi:chromate transport protein ChrA
MTDEPKVLDLTSEPLPGPETPPREVPVQVQLMREGYRGLIAVGLLLVIAGAVAAAFAASALHWAEPPALKDLLTQVYNPLIGLFGAVIGFYFGSMGQNADAVITRPKRTPPTPK